MSVEIAWKQNILVTDFQLVKSLLVVLGFGSQAFVCGFSRQNICSVRLTKSFPKNPSRNRFIVILMGKKTRLKYILFPLKSLSVCTYFSVTSDLS